MQPIATFETAVLNDYDLLAPLLAEWKINSMQLEQGVARLQSDRIVFEDLFIEKSVQNRAKWDEYQIPASTTCISFFHRRCSPGQWCGLGIPENIVLVNQSGRDHFAVLPAGFQHVTINLQNSVIVEWDLLPDSYWSGSQIGKRSLIPLSDPEGESFRRWLFALFESPSNLRAITSDPHESMLFREGLLTQLCSVLDTGLAKQGSRLRSGTSRRRFPIVRQACRLIDETLCDDISTQRLDSQLGISLRLLQRGFVDVFGVSPHQFIQRRKLQAIRRDLRNDEVFPRTISEVAVRYGITELGRFSVRYRQMFGESPSDTLRGREKIFQSSVSPQQLN